MELKWLEDFVALARAASFSRAAIERNVTQPAFSRRIRALETWLGAQLIDRAAFPVALTPQGEEFLPQAREIIAAAHAARQDFVTAAARESAAIRLTTLHSLALRLAPEVIAPFLASHSRLRVDVLPTLQGQDAHFEALESGASQLLFVHARSGDPPPGLAALSLGRETFTPVVAATVVAYEGAPRLDDPEATVPVLLYSPYTFAHSLVAPVVKKAAATLKSQATAPLTEALKPLVLAGLGVAWLPESSICDDLAAGDLVDLGITAPALRADVETVAYRRADLDHRNALRFWAYLEDRYAQSA